MNQELIDQVYWVVKTTIQERGIPPSHQEIADTCYISKGSVATYLSYLEGQGRIYREPHVARGIRLLPEQAEHMVTL